MPKAYAMSWWMDMAAQLGCDHGQLRSIRSSCRRWVSGFKFAWTLLACTVLASFRSRAVLMS
jgi:hypothetical protein